MLRNILRIAFRAGLPVVDLFLRFPGHPAFETERIVSTRLEKVPGGVTGWVIKPIETDDVPVAGQVTRPPAGIAPVWEERKERPW